MAAALEKIKVYLMYLVLCIYPITTIVSFKYGFVFNVSPADIFVLLICVVYMIDVKNFNIKRNFPFFWYFALLILLTVISGFVNMKSGVASVGYNGLTRELVKFAASGAYAFVAFNAINTEGDSGLQDSNIKTVAVCWLIGLYICIAYGLYAHLSTIFGRSFISLTTTLSGHNRFLGTQTDPNAVAFYLNCSFFLVLAAFLYVFKDFKMKLLLVITNIIIVLCILLTMSRGGWLGLASGVLFLLILNITKIKLKSLLYAAALFAAAIILLLLVDHWFMSGYIAKSIITRAAVFVTGGDTFESRINLSLASLKMGADHLPFGIGRGNFPLNSTKYIIDMGMDWEKYGWIYVNKIPHNTIAGLFVELGITGVSVFVSLFIMLLINIFKSRYSFLLKSIILALWVSILVQSFALSLENTRALWIVTGLLLRLMTKKEGLGEQSSNIGFIQTE